MPQVDYLVVGSGLTGATIARLLADAGRDVTVVDRRSHLAGNVADTLHPSGIRYCLRGPHYFRTQSDRIWEFATRFSDFYPYAAEVLTCIDGETVPWPLTSEYIRRKVGDWSPSFTGTPSNFEEQSLAMMPRAIYDKAVRPYTELQWGVPASSLAASLARRFDVRDTDERRLTPGAKYQGLPIAGYSAWVAEMLRGIDVRLDYDYLQRRDELTARNRLVFTGPIDEYYNFEYGKLHYRGQRREHTFIAGVSSAQAGAQVNNPSGPHIRSLEWRKMMRPDETVNLTGTLITTETPTHAVRPDDYEYPFPDATAANLYSRYRRRAETDAHLVFAGRLGTNRYLDMDQAIAAAMKVADDLLSH